MSQTLDRKSAPAFHALEKINVARASERRLDNGILVGVINEGTQDLVKVEFIFSAGVWVQEFSLQASCSNAMLSEGTKTLSAEQIADQIDFYGAYLEQDVNQDWGYVSLYTLNKHLGSVIPVLEDI